jgi:hypothetical protein
MRQWLPVDVRALFRRNHLAIISQHRSGPTPPKEAEGANMPSRYIFMIAVAIALLVSTALITGGLWLISLDASLSS